MYSTNKSTRELKTTVIAAKKAAGQEEIKVIALKKLNSSGDSEVQGGCAPDCRAVLEEAEGGDTMGISEGGGKLRVSRKGW